MVKALIIARKDIKEALHRRTTYWYMLALLLFALPYFDGLRNAIRSVSDAGAGREVLRAACLSFLNSAVSTLPLVLAMFVSGIFSAYATIMDKVKRNLESLLATPVSLGQVWLGKSLAVAVPVIAISLLVSALVIAVMNIMVIHPAAGSFIMPGALPLITGLVLVPVMTFFVVSLVSLIQLIMTNPMLANLVFTAVFLAIYFGTITEFTASWDFSLIYLAVILLLVVVIFSLSRFLTKERVILSSKG